MTVYLNPCQCEHGDHFNGKGHGYGQAAAVLALKTTSGTFQICQACAHCLKGYVVPEGPEGVDNA